MRALVPYMPQDGSIPAAVVQFFQNNPEEVLTADDIALKFGAPRSTIHSTLRMPVDAMALQRRRNDDGEYVYAAGPRISVTKIKTADTSLAGTRERAGPPPVVVTPEQLEALQVERNVPLYSGRGGGVHGVSKWGDLFAKLSEAGTSIRIPLDWQKAVYAQSKKLNKDGKGTFIVRKVDDTHARIWRTK